MKRYKRLCADKGFISVAADAILTHAAGSH
jgi:hypothetical protein